MTPPPICSLFFFFFNDTATTEIYTLSLHDALPISSSTSSSPGRSSIRCRSPDGSADTPWPPGRSRASHSRPIGDRKSTRLNSSHLVISYAVSCLKKKKHTLEQHASPHTRRTELCSV